MENIIYKLINENIVCQYLDVSGDGTHFDLIVVSDSFIDKNRVIRHKMIYNALGDKMREEIHALSMKLYTTDEWHSINHIK